MFGVRPTRRPWSGRWVSSWYSCWPCWRPNCGGCRRRDLSAGRIWLIYSFHNLNDPYGIDVEDPQHALIGAKGAEPETMLRISDFYSLTDCGRVTVPYDVSGSPTISLISGKNREGLLLTIRYCRSASASPCGRARDVCDWLSSLRTFTTFSGKRPLLLDFL